MSRKYYGHYARRIYELAMGDPTVNGTDPDAVNEYCKQKAEELCLPTEKIMPIVKDIQPDTVQFQKATHVSTDIQHNPAQ